MKNVEEKPSITIYSPAKQCTCIAEVFILLKYTGRDVHDYSLYKIYHFSQKNYSYFMLIDYDPFPLILTEEEANYYIENPEEGEKQAFNTYMNRYR